MLVCEDARNDSKLAPGRHPVIMMRPRYQGLVLLVDMAHAGDLEGKHFHISQHDAQQTDKESIAEQGWWFVEGPQSIHECGIHLFVYARGRLSLVVAQEFDYKCPNCSLVFCSVQSANCVLFI